MASMPPQSTVRRERKGRTNLAEQLDVAALRQLVGSPPESLGWILVEQRDSFSTLES
jgi:hypothetical protein